MTIAKIRNLSEAGVITDIDPFNLPANAWSMAVNARFRGGSVVRAPVFRRAPLTLSQTDPRFLTSNLPASGFNTVYIGYLNGRVSKYVSGVETNVSITGFVNNSAEGAGACYSSCILENVLYINRNDRTPWFLRNTDAAFQALTNWDSTWRANLLRQCGGALVALGVTKGATFFPTMYKTSEFAQINAPPSTWDSTVTTNNSTENTIADLQGNIIEAANLGQQLYIYGLNQTFVLTADGSAAVFNVQAVFPDRGCINANCVVEIDRKHYVFGLNDIWVHDGTSKQSICDLKTHDFIFGSINLSKSFRCFVVHDVNRKELRFCYPSGDTFLAFAPSSGGCNRCAVYNLIEKTWTFDDLPYVFGATMSNTDTTLTYNTVASTYDQIGGSYLDQEDSTKRNLLMVGDSAASYGLLESLYALDNQGPGSNVAFSVDTSATRPVTLYKDGIDLDDLPEVANNLGYKIVTSIYPEARFESGAQPLQFFFGSADHYGDAVVYAAPQTFDGVNDVRCDFFQGGRYLAMRILHNDYHYFNFAGIDVDLFVTGQV